jgi:3-hydroxymyristoyl/3-hydroxydecanoyl-(acyl carrier protein) dehydratase
MSRIEFQFAVAPDHPSLAGHFPGNPVVPGVLLLDRAIEALDRSTGRRVTRLHRVKFVSALRPGESAQGTWDVDGDRATFRIVAQRQGAAAKVAEGSCAVSAESGT